MNKSKLKHERVIWRCLNRLVRPFGFMLLPIAEIEQMEKDAERHYRVQSQLPNRDQEYGYWNGLADYSSKTALLLRKRYLPNTDERNG